MLFTKEQKLDFIIAFFGGRGGEGGAGRYDNIHFFLDILDNIGGSERQPEVAP